MFCVIRIFCKNIMLLNLDEIKRNENEVNSEIVTYFKILTRLARLE